MSRTRTQAPGLRACLTFALLLVVRVSAKPPAECRICEDVVNTWHDKFPCAGNFVNWGNPLSSDIFGCESPSFDCNNLDGQMKGACFGLRTQLSMSNSLTKIIWEAQLNPKRDDENTYTTCAKLGKCPVVKKSETPSECVKVFKNPLTANNWKSPLWTQHCTQTCYLCLWLVRDFPLFQEVCRPKGVRIGQNVPTAADDWGSGQKKKKGGIGGLLGKAKGLLGGLFLQMDEAEGSVHESDGADDDSAALVEVDSTTQHSALNPLSGLFNKVLRPARNKGSKYKMCYQIWDELQHSPKARYFGSWKRYLNIMSTPDDRLRGEMWDANVACKCLGKCPLNRFEDLGLMKACEYDEATDKMMRYMMHNQASGMLISHPPPTGTMRVGAIKYNRDAAGKLQAKEGGGFHHEVGEAVQNPAPAAAAPAPAAPTL